MPRQRTFLKGLILCALVGLSGCAIDWPVYQSPKLDLPPAPARKPASVDRQWWKAFEDPALDGLVADALANNLSLAKAAANVEEARALVGEARSLLSPRIDVGGRISATQRQLTIGSKDLNDVTGSAAAGATLNWEWDLWGRIRQTNDAALARLAASEHTRNAVELSVSYTVAEAYFLLLGLETKLRVTRESVRNLEEITHLEYRRWQAQVGTELAYR
jgi:multidrug efflux system outer membrane protein